jgi:hypothetical protein
MALKKQRRGMSRDAQMTPQAAHESRTMRQAHPNREAAADQFQLQ